MDVDMNVINGKYIGSLVQRAIKKKLSINKIFIIKIYEKKKDKN